MLFPAFRGGVHPDGFKELSSSLPIHYPTLPDRLFVPLRQHAGSEAIAIVKTGELVLKGQMIAKAGRGLSAPVHAPTSGKVINIAPVISAHPSGLATNSIVIEADGLDKAYINEEPINPFSLPTDQLAKKIADAGIVGMGGAAFPAAVKLSSAQNKNIKTLIINGGECEPYLTADDLLMCERPQEIILGARLIRYIIGCQKIVVAIEDNKPNAIQSMQRVAERFDNVAIKVVPSPYPMGSAKQLIQAVTGKEVPSGGRSSDVGVLMHNVATAYAIQQCLVKHTPLISRIVTVSGSAIAKPQNVEALIGTPIGHLIDHCGGTNEKLDRLLLGGPMMGQIVASDQVPMMKGTAGVLALTRKEMSQPAAAPCIRCARCVDACPMGLVPLEMANHSRHQDFDGAQEFGLSDCILCGSCAYVCPSHIPLVHYFQYAKGELSQQRANQQHLAHTQLLAEAKRERQNKEAEAKAAAKAAKAAKRKAKRSVEASS